jgi:dTDP-4-amino-4,6-dideoxygalactose transaminase
MYKCLHNPYKIVKMFEEEVANYTGAPFAISVDSCTSALFLCCKFLEVKEVEVPKHTYLSVPQAIMQAGGTPLFRHIEWSGIYRLNPYPIIDAAKRFRVGMYEKGTYMCLSFHIKKHLKIGKGGMILTDDPLAVDWFKKARYEGRGEKFYRDDSISDMGWNMYMTPQEAAHGLALMQNMPEDNEDLKETYRDLTEFPLFSSSKIIENKQYYDSRYSSTTGLE